MPSTEFKINYKEVLLKIDSLPDDTSRQLLEYIDFLWERYGANKPDLSNSERLELNRRIKKYEDYPETACSLEELILEMEDELGEKLYLEK